jgi:hypothetical protein
VGRRFPNAAVLGHRIRAKDEVIRDTKHRPCVVGAGWPDHEGAGKKGGQRFAPHLFAQHPAGVLRCSSRPTSTGRKKMAFARCPRCEYVQWQLGISDRRPAGECPDCSREMHWTVTPLEPRGRMIHQEREETHEAVGLRE